MSAFQLPSHDPSTDVHQSALDLPPVSLKRFIVTGGIGFCLVSLFVFGTVAFGQRWMYDRLGVTGAYIAWITPFILLGGRALVSLVTRTRRLLRFYAMFGAAFFAYGISWMVAYFTFKNALGEWLGSFAGSVSMALVFAAGFGVLRSAPLCLQCFSSQIQSHTFSVPCFITPLETSRAAALGSLLRFLPWRGSWRCPPHRSISTRERNQRWNNARTSSQVITKSHTKALPALRLLACTIKPGSHP